MGRPLTLPADPRAAQGARAFLTRELVDVLPEDALDTAKLLVSELVTNSVVHAASAVHLECDSTGSAVTVRVRDADTGPLIAGGAGPELGEGGRGLVLVEALSDAWGTEHSRGRKTVWFRLSRTPHSMPSEPAVPVAPADLADPTTLRGAERRLRTLVLPGTMLPTLTLDEHQRELLRRILDAVGAAGGRLRTASGDDLVVVGDIGGGHGHAFPLVFADRAVGTLTVHHADPDEEDLAFLRIAADRLSVLRYEHDVLRAEAAQATELEYVTDATELLAGTSSTRAALTLLTQLAVPRLGDWSAAYAVSDRQLARRVSASHRLEERLDTLADLLGRDLELDGVIQEAARTGRAVRWPLTVTVAGRRTLIRSEEGRVGEGGRD